MAPPTTAQRKYPDDPSRGLSGIEAILLADSEPVTAQALIEKVATRKAVNPSHHAAYFAASAWGADGTCPGGHRIAARSGRNRVSLLSVVRTRYQLGSDPSESTLPSVSRGHKETVRLSSEGTIRREVDTSRPPLAVASYALNRILIAIQHRAGGRGARVSTTT